jgi:anti-anti-sigma factor
MFDQLFQVTTLSVDGTCLVRLRGDLDAWTVERLERELGPQPKPDVRRLIVDMEQVTFIDLAGLDAVARVAKRSRKLGISWVIKPSPTVVRLVQLLRDQELSYTLFGEGHAQIVINKHPFTPA